MKMIDPSVTQITETNPFKKIELVGRTCYKSNSAMTEETGRKFFNQLVSRSHFAMLEHATFVFMIKKRLNSPKEIAPFHSIHSLLGITHPLWEDSTTYNSYGFLKITDSPSRILISGNLRAIIESGSVVLTHALCKIDPQLVYTYDHLPTYEARRACKSITKDSIIMDYKKREVHYVENLFDLPDLSEEEFRNHFYMTLDFITDRGVTHEMVRHRRASFAQESTRYCNYAKEKFGSEITVIKPTGWDAMPDQHKHSFIKTFESAEREYNYLISEGFTPQIARGVLPTELKTEIIMTCDANEWEHFFNLRSHGLTGAPHPDIKRVADMARAIYDPISSPILATPF